MKYSKIILTISILLNVVLIGVLFLKEVNSPTYKLGRLTRDIKAGPFDDTTSVLSLPKGLTVMDVSPQGLASFDLFESERFSITITTGQNDVVDYTVNLDSLNHYRQLYSMDSPDYGDRK